MTSDPLILDEEGVTVPCPPPNVLHVDAPCVHQLKIESCLPSSSMNDVNRTTRLMVCGVRRVNHGALTQVYAHYKDSPLAVCLKCLRGRQSPRNWFPPFLACSVQESLRFILHGWDTTGCNGMNHGSPIRQVSHMNLGDIFL